ncbi:hypothetical protein RQP46_001684 [Phenoliferia psychrophenolica]
MWVEVLEDGWDSAVLSAQDPLALKVVDKLPPTSHKRGRSTPTEEVDDGHVCSAPKARKEDGQAVASGSGGAREKDKNGKKKDTSSSLQSTSVKKVASKGPTPSVAAPSPAAPVDDSITLEVRWSGGPGIAFKIKPSSRFALIADRVALEMGKDVDDLTFQLDMARLALGETVQYNGLEDGDLIEVYPVQRGGKPVIYLFPPTPLASVRVDLSLVPEWTFSALYPVVPIDRSKAPHSGTTATWTVSASPSGDLVELSSGLSLSYLFWEAHTSTTPASPSLLPTTTSQTPAFNPSSTTLTPSTALALTFSTFLPYLDTVLSTLTLHTSARNDFITYWLPKFLAIRDRGQRIAFRFVEQVAYEQAARLDVEPMPDVMTRVFMTFQGVEMEGEWSVGGKGVGEVDWRDVVGVASDAEDGSKFRVLEWGGMELLQ